MTNDEAIKTLREDYCGNRIICELHPDQCNREECEIWLAIKALETQPDGDAVSRQDAIRIVDSIDTWQAGWRGDAIESLKALPHAQPEITPDGTLNISISADVASVGRILLSQTGTQRGGLYYKDAQLVDKDIHVPCNDTLSRQAMFDTAAEYEKQLREILGDENELVEVVKILKHRLIALPSAQPDLSSYSDKLWRSAYERGKAEAQAEIIACGDCKHWICHDRRCGYWNHGVKPLDWCCHAERKE